MKDNNSTNTKSSETLDTVVFAIADFANAIEAATVSLRQKLKELGPSKWDPKKIKWTEAEGTKGPYEKADPQATPDFKNMLSDLKSHNGKLMREGYFYWVFRDAATVGRKKKQRKKT